MNIETLENSNFISNCGGPMHAEKLVESQGINAEKKKKRVPTLNAPRGFCACKKNCSQFALFY